MSVQGDSTSEDRPRDGGEGRRRDETVENGRRSNGDANEDEQRDLIAHRGFAALYPENTLPALRRAGAHPRVAGLECDLRRCGSGEVVVCHDAVVDRVTDGEGKIADHTRDELAALSVLGSDAGIPTLEGVVETVPADVTLHLELKEPDLADDVCDAVADRDGAVVVSSFDPGALAAVTAAGEIQTALLFADDPGRNVDLARELGCSFVHPHAALCLDGAEPTTDGDDTTGPAGSAGSDVGFVARAHEADLGVNAWTLSPPGMSRRSPAGEAIVTDPDAPARLRQAGVDGLIADAPV